MQGSINPTIACPAGSASLNETATDWVRETAFGRWFLGTETWVNYVLRPAIDHLVGLLGDRCPTAGHILDLGCGEGQSIPLICRSLEPKSVTALDVDPDALAIARHTAASNSAVPIRIVRSTASRLPLPSSSVDVVLCHQLLHHLYHQDAAVAEIHRVLRPGGWLLLSESCRPFIESWPVKLLFRHPRGVQHDAGDYVEMVRRCGFSVADDDVTWTRPWWSTYDLGLHERVFPAHYAQTVARHPTEILLAGQKLPCSDNSTATPI